MFPNKQTRTKMLPLIGDLLCCIKETSRKSNAKTPKWLFKLKARTCCCSFVVSNNSVKRNLRQVDY